MQILTKLLCEDCGVNTDLYYVKIYKGKLEVADLCILCKSCIEKREEPADSSRLTNQTLRRMTWEIIQN